MTAVVDSSVWVSVFLPDEQHHERSRSWLERLTVAGDDILVPTLLRPELAGSIRRRTGDQELALQAVEEVFSLPGVRAFPLDDYLAQLSQEVAAALSLKGADAVYVALALQEKSTLVTWDREQRVRGGSRIAVATPD